MYQFEEQLWDTGPHVGEGWVAAQKRVSGPQSWQGWAELERLPVEGDSDAMQRVIAS